MPKAMPMQLLTGLNCSSLQNDLKPKRFTRLTRRGLWAEAFWSQKGVVDKIRARCIQAEEHGKKHTLQTHMDMTSVRSLGKHAASLSLRVQELSAQDWGLRGIASETSASNSEKG